MFKIITKGPRPTRRKSNSKNPLYSVCQDTMKRKIIGPNQVVFKCVGLSNHGGWFIEFR